MIVKSKGIVLNYIKYGDTSIIVKIYTKEYGLGSFIVNAIRSKNSKKSIGYFQPFSILDLVLYVKDSRDLQRISEFKNYIILRSIHQDLYKSTITLFLSEVFYKLLSSESSSDPSLYHFAESSIHAFDKMGSEVSNFHIQFLLKLAPYLGFEIGHVEQIFSSINQLVPASKNHSIMEKMLQEPYGTEFPLNGALRNEMLDAILSYYIHHMQISKPKSLEVLRSILS